MIKIDEIQPWMNWLMYPASEIELKTNTNNTGINFMLDWHSEIFQLDLAAMAGKFNIVMYYHVDGWTANTPPCNGWNIGGATADSDWSWANNGGTELSKGYTQVTAKTRRYYHITKILPTCHFERVLLWYYSKDLPTPRPKIYNHGFYSKDLPTPRPKIYNHGFFFVRTDGTDTFDPVHNRDVTFGDHGRYTFHCELVEQTNRGVTERSLQFGVYEGWRCLPSNVNGYVTIDSDMKQFYQAFHPWKVIPLPLFTPSSPTYTNERWQISLYLSKVLVNSVIIDSTYLQKWQLIGNEKLGTTERTFSYVSELPCADAWVKCYSGGVIIIAPAVLTEETWEADGGSLSFSIPAPKGDRSILPMMASGKHWAFMSKGRNFGYYTKNNWEWAKITVSSSDVDADTNNININVKKWV